MVHCMNLRRRAFMTLGLQIRKCKLIIYLNTDQFQDSKLVVEINGALLYTRA
uniref:Uncharacterized protein n=1 Tax=Rhizophora mucronata TaxID=61149 RepID=A0A2P2QYK9_RHIMU